MSQYKAQVNDHLNPPSQKMKFVGSVRGGIGEAKVLWKQWNIRTFVLASFTFQLFLILFAPFRKRSSSYVIIASTWLSYLLADWVAAQAVGLITRASEVTDAESELFALWAQFLLLHLGGPDTITALALEDNALWLRTGLHLGNQAYSTLGILVRSVGRSRLWAPMALMFVAGVAKYAERIMSLYQGRMMDVDEDPNPYLESLASDEGKELSNLGIVRGGFNLFHCYKRLYADHNLDPQLRKGVRMYFKGRTSSEAYRIVEAQLNFVYEAIYTKASVSHKITWMILRHIVFLLEFASLVIWFRFNRSGANYSDQDIRITDALVIGAVAVDCLALFRIQISDWSIARIDEYSSRKRAWLCNQLLSARQAGSWRTTTSPSTLIKMRSIFIRVFFARWSESIHDIDVDMDRINIFVAFTESVNSYLRIQRLTIWQWFLRKKRFSIELWDFIYDVLTKPVSGLEYKLHTGETIGIDTLVARALPLDILDFEDVVLAYWLNWSSNRERYCPNSIADHDIIRFHGIYNNIEGYVRYLYMWLPEMMYGGAGKHNVLDSGYGFSVPKPDFRVVYRGKGEEVIDNERKNIGILNLEFNSDQSSEQEIAKRQMEEISDFVTKHLDNEREASFLIAVVGTQVLCHAAISCRFDMHARQLKEGGELLSFIWMLMMHLGIGTKLHAPSMF